MKGPSFRVLRFGGYCAVLALVLSALVLTLLRFWWLPGISARLPVIERQVGQQIRETVRIGGIRARMRGFSPELVLEEVRILDPQGRDGVRFGQVGLGIDLFRSLAAGELVPGWVRIRGTRLSVRRRADGSIAVLGLNISDRPPAWILGARRVDLLDSRLDWQDLRHVGPVVDLGHADLHLTNDGLRHRLAARLSSPMQDGFPIEIGLDAAGDLFVRQGWRGTLYLAGRSVPAETVTALLPMGYAWRTGQLDVRLWSHWEAGQPLAVQGQILARQPGFALAAEAGPETTVNLADFAGWFAWRAQGMGWRLDCRRCRLGPSGQTSPEFDFGLAVARDGSGGLTALRMAGAGLPLNPLMSLVPGLPVVSPPFRDALTALAPKGRIEEVKLLYQPREVSGRRMAVCGRVASLSVAQWANMPGIDHLSGGICGTDAGGRWVLRILDGALVLPALFRTPIALHQVVASGHWRRTEDAWRIGSSALSLNTPDFSAAGRVRLDLGKQPGASSFLDLHVTVEDLAVKAIKTYLPYRLIPETAAFLERALIGGRVPRADVLFHGPMAAFPFADQEGVFEALVDCRKVDLQFNPSWPALTGVDGQLRFAGPALEIEAESGRIGEGEITRARAYVPDLVRESWLTVDGEVRSNLPAVMDFLRRSPLKHIPERLLRFAVPAGDTAIALKLKIPLESGVGDVKVEGAANLQSAELHMPSLQQSLVALRGVLQFTESGIRARQLAGTMLGGPVTLSVGQADGRIGVEVQGQTSTDALRGMMPPVLRQAAQGDAAYSLRLHIPEAMGDSPEPLRVRLHTDLRGVALHLPQPFAKAAASRRDLTVESELDAGSETQFRLSYGEELKGLLAFSPRDGEPALTRGAIAWNRETPPVPRSAGLAVSGAFSELDLNEWAAFQKTAPSLSRAADGLVLKHIELAADQVRWQGDALGALELKARRHADGWTGSVAGSLGKGSLRLGPGPAGYDRLQLNLEELRLPGKLGDASESLGAERPRPRALPSLSLKSRRVLWRDQELGALEIEADRQGLGLVIRKAELQTANYRLSLSGDWLSSGERDTTRLNGKLTVADLGRLASALGRGEELRETASTADFKLSWPGSPASFSWLGVKGDLQLSMGEGALLKIEPGLGRVLGMLNLNSIWRRLTLDFSDLFGQGLAYDGINGAFKLADGQAYTEGVWIEGLSTRILIKGRIGLLDRDLNQIVTVVPRTTVALPIAGALAGGPAIGAAVLVAQELIGEEVDSITATRYAVKGGWDQPTVTKIGDNLPLNLIDRAWSGLKDLSGIGKKGEQHETNDMRRGANGVQPQP